MIRIMLTIPHSIHDGLAFMTILAKYYDTGKLIPLRAVEKWSGIPSGYLEEIVIPLRRASLVVGSRGIQGGYKLAKNPGKITVGHVVEVIGGKTILMRHRGNRRPERLCYSENLWSTVEKNIKKTLAKHTLKDLVQ